MAIPLAYIHMIRKGMKRMCGGLWPGGVRMAVSCCLRRSEERRENIGRRVIGDYLVSCILLIFVCRMGGTVDKCRSKKYPGPILASPATHKGPESSLCT